MSQPIVERGTLLKVLDHGYVRIIDFMGNDESIVEAARMSTDKGFISWDPYIRCKKCKDVIAVANEAHAVIGPSDCPHDWERYPNGDLGLLDNLWRKKHATPFEMGEFVIEVQAPLFVFREWHRHRTQSYNEFSARYAVMPNLHYIPAKERIQKQSSANKQGSAEMIEEMLAQDAVDQIGNEQQDTYERYEEMVGKGIAREVARINTPVSRYSKMRAKGNIRNWFQFLNLRMRPDAQYEIRQYAEVVGKMISWLWPKAYGFFEEYDLYGAHFSRTELRVLREIFLNTYKPDRIRMFDDASKASGLTGTKMKEFIEKLEFGGDKILS